MPPPAVVEHPPMRVRALGRLTDEQIASLAAQLMNPIGQRLHAIRQASTSPPTTDVGRIKAALAANRWDDADPPGAYYVLNGLSLPRMRKVVRALSRAERQHLEANLEASGNDRPRMYLGIQQAKELPAGSKAEVYWVDWSERLFHAIRAGKYQDYPDGAYWILNHFNEEGRAYVLRFLHGEHLDALYDRGLDTAGIPHGKDILVRVHLERTRRRTATSAAALPEPRPLVEAAPRPVITLRGDHPDLPRLAAAFRQHGVDVIIGGAPTGKGPKASPGAVAIPGIPVPAAEEPPADLHDPALLVPDKAPAIGFATGLEPPQDRDEADAERRKKIDDLLLYTKYKIVAPLKGRSDSEAGRAFPNPEGDVERSVETWRSEEATFRDRLLARGLTNVDEYRLALDTFEATFLRSASSLAYDLLRAFEQRLREGEWVYSDDRAVEELIASARASAAPGLVEQARLRRGEVGGSAETGHSIERVQEDVERLRRDAEAVLRNLPGQPLVNDPLFPRMALLTAGPAEVKGSISQYVRDRRADTERARSILRSDPKAVYGMPVVIDQTMRNLGIGAGTALREIITDRQQEYGRGKKTLPFLLGLFSAILGVIGGVAALAGAAVSAYSGAVETSDYLDATALFGSGLSEEEQDFGWLVVDLLLTGLDVKQAADVLKRLHPFMKVRTSPEIERRLMRVAEDVRLGHVDRRIVRLRGQEALSKTTAGLISNVSSLGAAPSLLGAFVALVRGRALPELASALYQLSKDIRISVTTLFGEVRAAKLLTDVTLLDDVELSAAMRARYQQRLDAANELIAELDKVAGSAGLSKSEVADVLTALRDQARPTADDIQRAVATVVQGRPLAGQHPRGRRTVRRAAAGSTAPGPITGPAPATAGPSGPVRPAAALPTPNDELRASPAPRVGTEGTPDTPTLPPRTAAEVEPARPLETAPRTRTAVEYRELNREYDKQARKLAYYEAGLRGVMVPGERHKVALAYERGGITYVSSEVPVVIRKVDEHWVELALDEEFAIDLAAPGQHAPVPVLPEDVFRVRRDAIPGDIPGARPTPAPANPFAHLPERIASQLRRNHQLGIAWNRSPNAAAILVTRPAALRGMNDQHVSMLEEAVRGRDSRSILAVAETLDTFTRQGDDGVRAAIELVHHWHLNERDLYTAYFEFFAQRAARVPSVTEVREFIKARELEGIAGGEAYAKSLGWRDQGFLNPRAGRGEQGIDSVWLDPSTGHWWIVEYKGGPHARLHVTEQGLQMSDDWVDKKIRELIDEGSRWGHDLLAARQSGILHGLTLKTAGQKTSELHPPMHYPPR